MRRIVVGAVSAVLVVLMGAMPSGARSSPAKGLSVDPGEFPYGVAVFDVKPDRANLWTYTDVATKVRAEWSTDPAFGTISGSITFGMSEKRGGVALRPAKGLTPGTQYYYRFVDTANDELSRVGSFRTAPDPAADVAFTFDISGDQDGTIDPSNGKPCFNTFPTFQAVQNDHPAFYIDLGDTIYSDSECKEMQGGIGDDVTLDQYRDDHANQIAYDAWRNLRGALGIYSQWDDHEVRNDWDSQTVDPQLLANGRQAFMEWEGVKKWDKKLGFYRTWTWGANAQFFLLDERSFRTNEAIRMDADNDQVPDCNDAVDGCAGPCPHAQQEVARLLRARSSRAPGWISRRRRSASPT